MRFVDSDERSYDGDKKALRSEGVHVFDWDEGVSTESQVFNDVLMKRLEIWLLLRLMNGTRGEWRTARKGTA